jgi:hypothetical protein
LRTSVSRLSTGVGGLTTSVGVLSTSVAQFGGAGIAFRRSVNGARHGRLDIARAGSQKNEGGREQQNRE